MSKRFQSLAGARPVFDSASFQPVPRKARVTGKQIKALGNHALRTLSYESRPAKNGRVNNMVYQAECECFSLGMPSAEMLEQSANAFIYGGKQAAERNARHFADDKRNVCKRCRVLRARNGKCNGCE